jgi:hypothetical protein
MAAKAEYARLPQNRLADCEVTHAYYMAILFGVGLFAIGSPMTAQEQKQQAAELSKNETPGKAFTRFFGYQERL